MTDTAPRYVILDLADVRDAMGSHWDRRMCDEYTAACSVCTEQIDQTIDECPYCAVPVIWRSSKLWKAMYGAPATVERLLSVYPPDPDDDVGQELIQASGVTGFANQTEKKRWDRARRYLTERQLRNIIRHSTRKTYKRGILVYTLNIVDKEVRSRRTVKQRPTAPKQEINV